ncbi:MAG: AAA family ATPase [Clostridia bacterium]|nr:AAA family ATPase [Clostridia bacterium]
MQYLTSFRLPSRLKEEDVILNDVRLDMQCYSQNVYPFKIFPSKGLSELTFAPVTLFYGGNGSGKSTLLNVIAEKLKLERGAPFNKTPFYGDFLERCHAEVADGLPRDSRIITSDDVFDHLLDLRAINSGVERRRDELFEEYRVYKGASSPRFNMRSLDDYDELKERNEARHSTRSAYVARRMPNEVWGKSNGESAFEYFTSMIKGDALYLLDEPENSLSAKLQCELATFIEQSSRFYGCQFVISTHSPFLLAMNGVKIYDLDTVPVRARKWSELENIRTYFEFFEAHRESFYEN